MRIKTKGIMNNLHGFSISKLHDSLLDKVLDKMKLQGIEVSSIKISKAAKPQKIKFLFKKEKRPKNVGNQLMYIGGITFAPKRNLQTFEKIILI